VYYNTTTKEITIGCKNRTIQEWDDFFASDEVIETQRDTDRFLKIKITYELAKFAIEKGA
jgi:hypothetical protein